MDYEMKSLGEKLLHHGANFFDGGAGGSFRGDIETDVTIAGPIGSIDLVVADEVIGVLYALGESDIGESDDAVIQAAVIDVEEAAIGGARLQGGDIEGLRVGEKGGD